MDVGKNLLILSLIIEISFAQFPYKTFSCGSGEYIEKNLYCDGYPQCLDASDEPFNCDATKAGCDSKQHSCSSMPNSCIDADLISDVKEDCQLNESQSNSTNTTFWNYFGPAFNYFFSHSSEKSKFYCDADRCSKYVRNDCCNCTRCPEGVNSTILNEGDKSRLTNCSLEQERFLCDDGRRCLNLEYTCDGYCNCFDCSDEFDGCFKIDKQVLRECPHSYFPSPAGPQCISNSNSSSNTSNIRECPRDDVCDQKCTLYKKWALCSCSDGYIKVPNSKNGFRCQSNITESLSNTIIYSTPSQIKLLNLTTRKVDVIQKSVECKLLTAAHDYLYYTTYSNDSKIIFKKSFNSTASTNVIESNSSITSIAVDYITDNLYFTTNTSLSVCNTTAGNRTCMKLKCCNVNYIALAPKFRWMFYTKASDEGKRFIMKSNMDGSNEHNLIEGSFRSATSLVVDESIKRLYWLDPDSAELFSASFHSGNSEIRTFQFSKKVLSITALDSRLYFTRLGDHEIYILENTEKFTKLINETSKLEGYRPNFDSTELLLSNSNSGERLIEKKLTIPAQLYAFNLIQQRKLKANHSRTDLDTPCTGVSLLPAMNSTQRCQCPRPDNFTGDLHWCDNSTLRRNNPTSTTVITSKAETTTKKSSTQPGPTETTSKKSPDTVTTSTSSPSTNSDQYALPSNDDHEKSSGTGGWTVFFVIVILMLVAGGMYFVYYRRRRHNPNFSVRNWVQTQYNTQMTYEREL